MFENKHFFKNYLFLTSFIVIVILELKIAK